MPHVYLIHLSPALAHAKHYCGSTPNGVRKRMAKHKAGHGARLTQAALEAGCQLRLARTWELDTSHDARVLERTLKNNHRLADFCPICRRITREPIIKAREVI